MLAMTMGGVSFDLRNALTAWMWRPFPIFMLAVLIGLGYWYMRADWMMAARGRRWKGTRTASFLAGLVMVELAIGSPVATFTGEYFQAHVIQHLLLMAAAPALLALGAPSTLLLQTASRKTKVRWLKVLNSKEFALLTHPLSVWVQYFGLMYAFFLSPLINTAMLHMPLMDVFNILFLLGGCLFWWPVIGSDPIVHWKMGYGASMANMLLGGAVETFLGVIILMSHNSIASMYTVASTHAGGGLLWISTEVVTVAGIAPIFFAWMRSEQREGARSDARQDALVAVDLKGSPPSAPAEAVRKVSGPVYQLAGADSQLTTWESAWLARTGSVPARRVPPRTEPDPQQST